MHYIASRWLCSTCQRTIVPSVGRSAPPHLSRTSYYYCHETNRRLRTMLTRGRTFAIEPLAKWSVKRGATWWGGLSSALRPATLTLTPTPVLSDANLELLKRPLRCTIDCKAQPCGSMPFGLAGKGRAHRLLGSDVITRNRHLHNRSVFRMQKRINDCWPLLHRIGAIDCIDDYNAQTREPSGSKRDPTKSKVATQ